MAHLTEAPSARKCTRAVKGREEPRIIPVHRKGRKVAELWLTEDFSGHREWRVRWFRGSQVARHHVDTQVAVLNAQLNAKTPPQPKP